MSLRLSGSESRLRFEVIRNGEGDKTARLAQWPADLWCLKYLIVISHEATAVDKGRVERKTPTLPLLTLWTLERFLKWENFKVFPYRIVQILVSFHNFVVSGGGTIKNPKIKNFLKLKKTLTKCIWIKKTLIQKWLKNPTRFSNPNPKCLINTSRF